MNDKERKIIKLKERYKTLSILEDEFVYESKHKAAIKIDRMIRETINELNNLKLL